MAQSRFQMDHNQACDIIIDGVALYAPRRARDADFMVEVMESGVLQDGGKAFDPETKRSMAQALRMRMISRGRRRKERFEVVVDDREMPPVTVNEFLRAMQ